MKKKYLKKEGDILNNWFIELSSININEHVKQKNGLNYLSWMWAWQELKKRYPLSYATVHEQADGSLVWRDPIGGHVKTSVTIVWNEEGQILEHTVTEYLPCMDFRNKTVPYENIDSMLVNKTIQRSLTKCIARLGIGGYLFANEDLPEELSKTANLQNKVDAIVKKKITLSEKAKEKVVSLCKEAESEANPELDESLIHGNYKNINDVDILEKLQKKLLAVRK